MRSARTFGVCIVFLSTLAMAQSASIPTIEQPVVPSAAQPGGAGFTLTINGAGFNAPPTAVLWGEGTNVTHLKIAGSTSTQVTVAIPASLITTAGTASVSLLNASGNPSNVQFFQIATPASPQFAPPVDYGVGTSGTVGIGFTLAADFNGDGILDLAVAVSNPVSGPAVAVLLGNSDGTFQSATSYPVDDATSIVAGRFTNDGGSIDLVAGQTLLVGNGDGTFQAPTSLGVKGFRAFAVGDFSQTGALDIAGLIGNTVQILDNNGEGSFTAGQNFASGTAQFGGMLAADFNGDGILDLAVLDVSDELPVVRVFLGSAEGFSGGNALVTDIPLGGVAFTAADFNGDGQQDIAFVYNPDAGGGAVLILTGNGTGFFTSGTPLALANPVSAAIVTADFNEDGKLDLATGTYILLGNGDGTFETPINFGGTAQVLATGDFNGDGRPDLVAEGPSEVAILLQAQTGVPVVTLKPTSLNFVSQTVGTTASLPVTLSNTGNALLTISSISIIGTNATELSQTNNCGASLEADSSCTINVTFTPTANGGSGSATASLSIADNAAGTPQAVPITATVQNFSLTTTCESLSVVPGQTAIFTVDLAPVNGFTQSVSLSCTGAPALATCTVSPNPIALNGSTTVQAKVTATTAKATGFLQFPVRGSNGNRMAGLAGLAGIAGLAALVILPGKRGLKPRRRLCGLIFILCMLAILVTLPSCAGGGGDPPGTAAGTYPLTVTGTFQSATETAITESVSFNLVVQ
jgi:hypothetical protein